MVIRPGSIGAPLWGLGRSGHRTQACARIARFDLGWLGSGLWPLLFCKKSLTQETRAVQINCSEGPTARNKPAQGIALGKPMKRAKP
jgi:hypothetical protein